MIKIGNLKIKNFTSISFDYNFSSYFHSLEESATFGIIHSVFDRVVNIYNGKVIIPIVRSDIGNGPYTLRINLPEDFKFSDLPLKKGQRIIKRGNILFFYDDLSITIFTKHIWKYNKTKILDLDPNIIIRNYNILKEVLINRQVNGGCRYHILKNDIGINPNLIEMEISKCIDKLILNLGDSKKEDLKSLIGLGIGLTPSGDDFLTGFITTLSRIKMASNIYFTLGNNLRNIEFSTTDISVNMLNSAGKGEAREEVLNLIYGFSEKNIDEFKSHLHHLLEIGSSSGTDLAVGIGLAFSYMIRNKSNLKKEG